MIGDSARVAVVDDVQYSAEITADITEEAGFEPAVITETDGKFQRSGELVERIRAMQCEAVICDHRLSQTPFASFTGAELISRMYRASVPGLLVSTFTSIDSDSSIRRFRADIPSLIGRDDLDPEHIRRGLEICSNELAGKLIPERRARRTLVRVVDVSSYGKDVLVDAIVHTWKPSQAVRFPLDLIDDPSIRMALSHDLTVSRRLFASVNVGCRDDDELFFRAFEFAPEPDVELLAK